MIVAQISDIHADGSERAIERLDKVLEWLRPLRPDALIVSGDLCEADFETEYPRVRKRLEKLGAPYFVVPGNVDDHAEMRRAFGDRFAWTSDRPLNCTGVVGDMRLIGLDVTVDGADHGDAAPVLDWLATELAESLVPTLIFQHQHPFPTAITGKDRNICFNGDGLAAVIEAAGETVVGFSCGHVHRPLFTTFAGRQATMAPSIKKANRLRLDDKDSEVVEPPGLLVHHLRDGRLVSHVVMVG
ncbi:metallophosphoesterase [Devosia sediminis]|uniref:Metallophosphoesterase n=1 Tax=Devosia sediminis TaxID=2798801 RepID=A0A934MPU1_9HYPH|nr:metallophosphoesterase [Devosia sediminis]MBJ3783679.1 metallophosphoesterase [Devosia sediminis]